MAYGGVVGVVELVECCLSNITDFEENAEWAEIRHRTLERVPTRRAIGQVARGAGARSTFRPAKAAWRALCRESICGSAAGQEELRWVALQFAIVSPSRLRAGPPATSSDHQRSTLFPRPPRKRSNGCDVRWQGLEAHSVPRAAPGIH